MLLSERSLNLGFHLNALFLTVDTFFLEEGVCGSVANNSPNIVKSLKFLYRYFLPGVVARVCNLSAGESQETKSFLAI